MDKSLSLSENSSKSLTENVNNSNQELFSTKDVASALTVSERTVRRVAEKMGYGQRLSESKNGRPGLAFTKKEVTLMLDYMQHNNNRSDLTSTTVVKAASTELTPSLRMIQAMEMFKAAADEELARLRAENVSLNNYKFDTEKKLANGELVETPSENARNHLWQNLQKVGSAMNDYRRAWHEFWQIVKRDLSIDVPTRSSNKGMSAMNYVCGELGIDTFNKIYALSEKMKKDYCGK